MRQALEYYKKLIAFLPPDAPAWDDGSNNKWLVSGKGALIMNPPSAWAVARRDAPEIAAAMLDPRLPGGSEGPLRAVPALFLEQSGISPRTRQAAKSLLVHLSQPAAIEKLVAASGGYDLPAYEKLTTLKTWAEEGPPKGTLYHYPNPYNHQKLSIAASPAPPKVAQQIYTQATLTKMCRALLSGRSDGKDAGLGGRRVRRLHAELTRRSCRDGHVRSRGLPQLRRIRQASGGDAGRHRMSGMPDLLI